ncbi:MAG: tRNA 2-thiocytidine(32) synthetase TtcA [Clostridiales bacterium]|jgi:tRNA(Ile)-lysidine synthase TilS/MesJ|nr:tRNA 2-thiocytidine(32) synthetase TtcA [Clostridiales bacterium]
MTLQTILSGFRRCVGDYQMIQEGDRIAVGLSGGKDSLTLLEALAAFRRFSPAAYSLMAVTVDMGLKETDYSGIQALCKKLDVPYHIEYTEIGNILFTARKEKNPCSLCSKMRRGALNALIVERGFNKLALGHHADDLIETFLLSLFYEGRLSSFAPVSFMDKSGVTLIRPLLYLKERDIAAYAKALPVVSNCCPANHNTQREYMKGLLRSITGDIPFAKDRMLGAILHPERYNLLFEKPGPEKPL